MEGRIKIVLLGYAMKGCSLTHHQIRSIIGQDIDGIILSSLAIRRLVGPCVRLLNGIRSELY